MHNPQLAYWRLLLLLLRSCSLYLEIRVDCGRLWLTSSNCQTLNPHLRQMQGSWWYLLYKPRYSPFCLKFCCHGNKGRSGLNSLSSIWWPISENSPADAKNLVDISYTSRVIANFVPNFVAMATGVEGNVIGSIRWRISVNLAIGAKILQKSFTQAEL